MHLNGIFIIARCIQKCKSSRNHTFLIFSHSNIKLSNIQCSENYFAQNMFYLNRKFCNPF